MNTRFLRHCLYSALANRLMPNILVCEPARARLVRSLLGVSIGPGVTLNAHLDFGNDARLITIGAGSHMQRRGTLLADWGQPITIGRDVWIGAEVMLWTGTHEIGPAAKRCGPGLAHPILIGDGCWLGARVTVLGGVEIGAGSVVAAGALVNKSIPPNQMWGGVPARLIKRLDTEGTGTHELRA